MGLIGWIKSKYYNHRMNVANKHVANGDISEAELVYQKIIDKHDDAPICLAELYLNNAQDNNLKIQRLKQIEDLRNEVVEDKMCDFTKILKSHVSNITSQADILFAAKDYIWAVKLSESVYDYFKSDEKYNDKLHRYRAYQYLEESQHARDYKTALQKCVQEIQSIKFSKDKDLRDVWGRLYVEKKFQRGVFLLLPFKGLNSDVTDSLVDCVTNIVDGNDYEKKNPNSLIEVCNDAEICDLAARELVGISNQYSTKLRFDKAVRLDDYAAEYLSLDTTFNLSRCKHRLEECAVRSNAKEIEGVFKLANELKLSKAQITQLEKRTHEITEASDSVKAINICRLFLDNENFGLLYINKAKELAKSNSTQIEGKELRSLIGKYIKDDKLYDVLADFVHFIPSFKDEYYNKANEYFDKGETDSAYNLCSKLTVYPSSWLELYLQLREKEIASEKSVSKKYKFYQESLRCIIEHVADINKNSTARYNAFWNEYATVTLSRAESQPLEKAIDSLCDIRGQLANYGKAIFGFTIISDNLRSQTAKARWKYGNELELEFLFAEAIKQYASLKDEKVEQYTNRAILRTLICTVKAESVADNTHQEILNALKIRSYQALREDLAYRYVLYLLKNTKPRQAEEILNKYLPEESQLKEVCKNIYIKEAEQKLANLNVQISQMREGSLPVSEALWLQDQYDGVISLSDEISQYLPDVSDKVLACGDIAESYIIGQYFLNEEYKNAFEYLLHGDKNYWRPDYGLRSFIYDKVLLRNLAIAGLGMIENNELDIQDSQDKNWLSLAIAIWISAVHNDQLFIDSLDYTSWDDSFTFTLENSLGATTDDYYEEGLPDNINFNDAEENKNIAIRDVQNNLLARMEKAIRENYPSFEDFYNKETSALERLIELNLDEDHFCVATPHLASQQYDAMQSIQSALQNEYDQNYDNNEDVLAIGVTYGLQGEAFKDYDVTRKLAENCAKSLGESLTKVKAAFKFIDKIRYFDHMFADLKAKASTRMNQDIKDQMSYDKFVDVYEVVCSAIKDKAMSMTCANYVNGEIIQRLNKDTMQEKDGVLYLSRVYVLCKDNVQVKQNLEAVLCALARDCEESPNSQKEAALNQVLRSTGSQFKVAVDDARATGKLNAVVEKVNKGRMKQDAALKIVYDLYKRMPDNDRVCENLATLCSMCINKYIIGDDYSSSVKPILDALVTSSSTTFKQHAKKLGQEFRDIMSQIPASTKELLYPNPFRIRVSGTTLNEKGYTLKNGLEYLRKLGGASVPNSGRGLLGLDDDFPF